MAATPILPIDEVVTAFYLRLVVADQAGVLAASPASWPSTTSASTPCCSAKAAEGEKQTDLIILTHDTVEGRMKRRAGADAGAAHGAGADRRIRKEELN
jgi:homoserine dehydrogenase